MSKHTWGPWMVNGKTELCITNVNGRIRFLGSASVSDSDNYEEAKANARLMAAAPDLLEALEIIHKYWDNDKGVYAMIEALSFIVETAEKAIAKARGEKHE